MDLIPLPDKVFKYRSTEAAFKILEEQIIYLPSVSMFNDPFDCKIPMNFEEMSEDEELQRRFAEKFLIAPDIPQNKRREEIDRILAIGSIKDKERLRKMEEARVRKMEEVFGVFCLSVIPDNLLMWSHYGDSHKGVCIGFNPKKLIDAISPTWVAPITYSFDYPKISVLEHPEQILEIMLFNKSIEWHYEKEIRIVKSTLNGACEINIPTEAIEEIYLGCLATEVTKNKIVKICNQKYQHVRISKFNKDKMNFALEITDI